MGGVTGSGRGFSWVSIRGSSPGGLPGWAPPTATPRSHFGAHRSVGNGIGAKGSILAGERSACSGHQVGAAGAGTQVGDKAVGPWPVRGGRLAAQGRVVGAAHGQEVRRGVASHHLPRVGKDGGGEEAKGVDPWGWGGKGFMLGPRCRTGAPVSLL